MALKPGQGSIYCTLPKALIKQLKHEAVRLDVWPSELVEKYTADGLRRNRAERRSRSACKAKGQGEGSPEQN